VSFGEEVLSFRVVGIAIVGGIEGSDVAGENGLVTGEGLQRIDPEDGMSTVGVSLDPDAPPGADERLAEALGETSIGPLDPPTAVVNLSRVRGVPFLVAGLVGLLLVLTLGHQLLVAVRRRARDFAVLRSFGANSRWVGGVVHWQASLSTAVAVVLAIPLGVLAGSLLYRPYAEGVGARGEAALPVGWLVGGFVVLVVVANLVAAIPARRIRRLSLTALLTRS
jgi:ABC-type antimicrobial peptide transport system permease subunit